MQLSRVGAGVALVMCLATSALAQKVTTDFDPETNFSQYKTFMWIKAPVTRDPLMQQRVIDAVNAQLTSKGLRLVTMDADLGIAAHGATQEKRTLETFYDGFGGGWRWGGGFGTSSTRVNSYEVGTLVVDIFDAKTKAALWRATSTKTLSDNPQKNAASLNKAVVNMFKAYPPERRTHAN